jgi:outer membrane protein assembly factor BamB
MANQYGDTNHIPNNDYPLAPGTVLQGRFTIERPLGRGGMGSVYIVRDGRFSGARPQRALKEMIPPVTEQQFRQGLVSFEREASILASLDHPFIPNVYDSFNEHGRAYLVLQYIEGKDLYQILREAGGSLDPDIVVEWMLKLCDIVTYLHGLEPAVIFRDLKPSNVILTPKGEVYLIDFGIAKVWRDEGENHTLVGTHGYAAPEMYEQKAEPRSDIYSLGAMLYHLVTDTDPRIGLSAVDQRSPRQINPRVSPALEAVMLRCLQREPADRYQTIQELRHALEQATDYYTTGIVRARGISAPARPTLPERATGKSPRVVWRFLTEEQVRSTPLLAGDTLYVGSYDNNLYALDARTGRQRWKFATEGGICCRPAIWQNLVIFGSEDFNVYAVDVASGREIWRYRTWHHVRSSPCVADDKVYIGSDDTHLHAIDPRTGRLIRRYRTGREVQSTPAYADGVVFFGSGDQCFYAVDALTLDLKWKYRTQGAILSSPAVADDRVYFGAMDFGVYALEAKSSWLAWREATDRFVISSPLVLAERVYIGSTDKHLHCLDRRTGHHLWKFQAGQQVNSSPVASRNTIYFGCIDGAVYAVDAVTGTLRWRYPTEGMVPGSPVVRDGIVYIGSADGNVYALEAQP